MGHRTELRERLMQMWEEGSRGLKPRLLWDFWKVLRTTKGVFYFWSRKNRVKPGTSLDHGDIIIKGESKLLVSHLLCLLTSVGRVGLGRRCKGPAGLWRSFR